MIYEYDDIYNRNRHYKYILEKHIRNTHYIHSTLDNYLHFS